METIVTDGLASVLTNEANIRIFAQQILLLPDDEEMRMALYEVIYALQAGTNIKEVFSCLSTGSIGFNGTAFKQQREKQIEEDEFITNPAEVEEGVHECERCGSKRTVSFTLQTQSGDEATAVWAQCVECKKKWESLKLHHRIHK